MERGHFVITTHTQRFSNGFSSGDIQSYYKCIMVCTYF